MVLRFIEELPKGNLIVIPPSLKLLGGDFRLVRVGEKIENSIQVHPKDEKEMNEIYNACDIFISTSLDEGFGYPVVEALRAGMLVAVSDIPVHREILGSFGVYFKSSSPLDVSEGIKEAFLRIDDPYKHRVKWLSKFEFSSFKINMKRFYEHKKIQLGE